MKMIDDEYVVVQEVREGRKRLLWILWGYLKQKEPSNLDSFLKTTSVCPVACPSLLTSETTSFYDTNLLKRILNVNINYFTEFTALSLRTSWSSLLAYGLRVITNAVKQSVSLREENFKFKGIKKVRKGISKLFSSIQQIASLRSQWQNLHIFISDYQ